MTHTFPQRRSVDLRVAVPEGAIVAPGELLVETTRPALETDVAKLDGRRRELQAAADSELGGDMVKRRISQLEIDEADHRLTIERQRQGELRLHARSAGQVVLAKAPASDLPGRHVQQGELIGYEIGRAHV